MDSASGEKAVQGQQAVLSSLGAGVKGMVRSEGTRQIVCAMEKAGIRRLISLSTLGVGDSWETLSLKYKILSRTLLRKALADHEAQENHIKKSQLDWTIVRPGGFTNGRRTGGYRHGFAGRRRLAEHLAIPRLRQSKVRGCRSRDPGAGAELA